MYKKKNICVLFLKALTCDVAPGLSLRWLFPVFQGPWVLPAILTLSRHRHMRDIRVCTCILQAVWGLTLEDKFGLSPFGKWGWCQWGLGAPAA